MEINDLIKKFGSTRENQQKAIFSTLFITGNRLQTMFDNDITEISLKQFMLLIMVQQSKQQLTFTKLGELLGCSRQNIKKLALALEKKGYVEIHQSEKDIRAAYISPTQKMMDFFEIAFLNHQKKLDYLFEVYSDEEVVQMFRLLSKLYEGIEHLERRLADEKQ